MLADFFRLQLKGCHFGFQRPDHLAHHGVQPVAGLLAGLMTGLLHTVLDIPPAFLSPESGEALRKRLL